MIYENALTPELLEKVQQSEKESEGLTKRAVRCPYCSFLLDYVFSDATGHREIRCPKCKSITIMNMAYFRTVKQRKYPEINPRQFYIR